MAAALRLQLAAERRWEAEHVAAQMAEVASHSAAIAAEAAPAPSPIDDFPPLQAAAVESSSASSAPPPAAPPPPQPAAPPPTEAEPPAQYMCPITQELMSDPVMTTDGHVYDRHAITQWLHGHNTSPATGVPLAHHQPGAPPVLYPVHALRSLIQEWRPRHHVDVQTEETPPPPEQQPPPPEQPPQEETPAAGSSAGSAAESAAANGGGAGITRSELRREELRRGALKDEVKRMRRELDAAVAARSEAEARLQAAEARAFELDSMLAATTRKTAEANQRAAAAERSATEANERAADAEARAAAAAFEPNLVPGLAGRGGRGRGRGGGRAAPSAPTQAGPADAAPGTSQRGPQGRLADLRAGNL